MDKGVCLLLSADKQEISRLQCKEPTYMPGRSLTGPIGSPLKTSCRTSRWLQTGSAPTLDAPHWCREPRGHRKRHNSPCHPIFPFPELIQIIGPALPFVLPCRTRKYGNMPDKSITKVSSEHAPKGRFGQKYHGAMSVDHQRRAFNPATAANPSFTPRYERLASSKTLPELACHPRLTSI